MKMEAQEIVNDCENTTGTETAQDWGVAFFPGLFSGENLR